MTHAGEFIADVLARAGIGADTERAGAAYADERVAEKIARLPEARQREGLAALDATLREREVPPDVRLHLVTAVAHLGRIAEETLDERHERTDRQV